MTPAEITYYKARLEGMVESINDIELKLHHARNTLKQLYGDLND